MLTRGGDLILATVLYTDAANTAVANMALYGRVVFEMDGTGKEPAPLLHGLRCGRLGRIWSPYGPGGTQEVARRRTRSVARRDRAQRHGPGCVDVVSRWTHRGDRAGRDVDGGKGDARRPLAAREAGEFFGLFSLAGKVSAVFGPALTAVFLFVFGGGAYGYRISIGSLAVIMAGPLLPPPRPRRPPGTQRRRVRPEDGHP